MWHPIAMHIRCLNSINEILPEVWDALAPKGYPFLRHVFLAALENSGSVSPKRGWVPCHLVVENNDDSLQALLPLYRKQHSWGEYVFDFQWAEAWARAGHEYYPKLSAAIPFSPVEGPRLIARCIGSRDLIIQWLNNQLDSGEVSSAHILFNQGDENCALKHDGWVQRLGCQFHWFNRNYTSFADFLAVCNSRKRKNFRKERAQVAARGIDFEWLKGEEINTASWERFYPFYAATYLKRGQHPYLEAAFFKLLNAMSESLRLIFARVDGRDVAGAMFLVGDDTLYGRYWGCIEEYEHLHFETCFYQGMDLCIAEGLSRFDAGAQGEQKLLRGFEPVLTQSWHKLQPRLHDAVADFLKTERDGVKAYQTDAATYLPYRQDRAN